MGVNDMMMRRSEGKRIGEPPGGMVYQGILSSSSVVVVVVVVVGPVPPEGHGGWHWMITRTPSVSSLPCRSVPSSCY